MRFGKYEISENKVIMRIKNRVCETPEELFLSDMFYSILKNCLKELKKHDSYLLGIFKNNKFSEKDITVLKKTFLFLTKMNSDLVPNVVIGSKIFFKDKALLNEFVEYLYNYWRSYDRFLISESQEEGENRAYRIFNNTIEQLTHLVRSIYRDVQENITNTHPSIYRQLRAGAEVAAIAVPKKIPFKNNDYKKLNKIHLVRQILLYPPLILNPPMNKRTGMFERITKNPLKNFFLMKKTGFVILQKSANF